MADELRMTLLETLRKAGVDQDVDFLRAGVRVIAEAVMDAEVTQHLGAAPQKRTAERTGQRNGYRERQWGTRVGSINLQVPRVRDRSYFPTLLEPRRRAERALLAVVQEAYVQGVSTRRVADRLQALGLTGMSKSQVSRMCTDLDAEVAQFRNRPLAGSYPYLWLDATYLKVRQEQRVVSQAVVIATDVRASGEREMLGLDVGPSEYGGFWLHFLRGPVTRELTGVQLAIRDAHAGLHSAIGAGLSGASWQRCRVHFVRNALALGPKSAAHLVAASSRTVFAKPNAESTRTQWRRVREQFAERFPRLTALLDDAEADILAYLCFPPEHWRQIWSNNPLERLNKEVKRRSDVVGIFPTIGPLIRLVGMVLAEQHDERQTGRRDFSAESLAKLLWNPWTALRARPPFPQLYDCDDERHALLQT